MKLPKSKLIADKLISISGSKSISNRLLVLEKLFGNLFLSNLSNSEDSQLMTEALNSQNKIVDIHHAGTAMRFLTSYFAIQGGKTTILTGSDRMKQRPIAPLVNALRDLGADIEYLENNGFPPLKINGKHLTKNLVQISASVSSQFLTSLLLIAGKLENGLTIEIQGEITSLPYLKMTLKILSALQIENEMLGNTIYINKFEEATLGTKLRSYEIESDWSSASYFYSLSAIGREIINLKTFQSNSLQGDSIIKELYWNYFGVNTISDESAGKISLFPDPNFVFPENIELDMNSCPDIAQTLCVTATSLKIPFHITGLATLKVKETDRLVALKNELAKIGCITEITENSIKSINFEEPNEKINIKTYNDHRMAMSFAPFCLIKELEIENADVVVKSYPQFWEDLSVILKND